MFGKLLESSIGLSIRYYSTQAYETAVGIFHQVERFGFGYTREFVQDPKVILQKLISKARSSEEGYSVISLGYLGGNYAVITPRSQSQLVELINQFDKEQSSRKGHASFKFFLGMIFLLFQILDMMQCYQEKIFLVFLHHHDLLTLRSQKLKKL